MLAQFTAAFSGLCYQLVLIFLEYEEGHDRGNQAASIMAVPFPWAPFNMEANYLLQ